MAEKGNNQKTNKRSGFDGPTYGVAVDPKKNPAKYLPNGKINPEWKKKNPGK